MKLYHAPGSCSQAICIVLQETGLNAETIKVDARKHLLVQSFGDNRLRKRQIAHRIRRR
jgi:hypothetical protein